MPSTAKIKRIMASSPPILARAGRVATNVPNMTLRLLAVFTSLNILMILKDLSMNVVDPMLVTICAYSKANPIMESRTTKKSNKLKFSIKYILPKAHIFRTVSSANKARNAIFEN